MTAGASEASGDGRTARPELAQVLALAWALTPSERLHIMSEATAYDVLADGDALGSAFDPRTGTHACPCVPEDDIDDVSFLLHLGSRFRLRVLVDRLVPHAERFRELSVEEDGLPGDPAGRRAASDLVVAALGLAVRSSTTGLYAYVPAGTPIEADLHAVGFRTVDADAGLGIDLARFDGTAHLRAATRTAAAHGLRLVTLDTHIQELAAREGPDLGAHGRARDRAARTLAKLESTVWPEIGAASRFGIAHYAAIIERITALAGQATSLLLDQHGNTVGVAMVTDRDASLAAEGTAQGHITALLPEWRGRGLGRALKAASCAWTKDAGLRRMVMRTRADGAMYRAAVALGFVEEMREAYLERSC